MSDITKNTLKIIKSGYFDYLYYYNNRPDVLAAGVDGALHYLQQGWREGSNPSQYFSNELYLKKNKTDICPLLDYINNGCVGNYGILEKHIKRKEYDIIYSIGRDCACSFYLQTNKLRTTSGPMDWITTADFKQRFDMLLTNFKDFMNPEYFEFLEKNPNITNDDKCDYYRNTKTGFDFYHDFPVGVPFSESFTSVAEKYNRRINRFYKNIKENKKVLLIWFSHYTDTNNKTIVNLCKKFCKHVNKKIDFLIIEHTEKLFIPKKTILAKNITKYNLHTRDLTGQDPVNGNKQLVNTIFQKYKIKNNIIHKPTNKLLWFQTHVLCSLIPVRKWRRNARRHIARNYTTH